MSRFFLTVFSLFFLSFNAFSAAQTKPSSNIYLVENIQTKASGKTALAARNQALQNARRDGLAILFSRLNIPVASIDDLSDEDIADMARSEQIMDEKMSGKSYSATMNIVYSKSFVEHIINKKTNQNASIKTNFSSGKNSQIALLIPVLKQGNKNLIWEDSNSWRYFLKLAAKKDFSEKFILPEGKLEDVQDVNNQNISNLNFRDIEDMVSRYRAHVAYILTFDYDATLNKAVVEVESVKEFQKRKNRLAFYNKENLDLNSVRKSVASKTLGYLSGSLVSKDSVSSYLSKSSSIKFQEDYARSQNEILINVRLDKLSDLARLKAVIENSNLAENFNFLTISRDSALISLHYVGSNEITNSFAPYGLQLYPDQKNNFIGNLL